MLVPESNRQAVKRATGSHIDAPRKRDVGAGVPLRRRLSLQDILVDSSESRNADTDHMTLMSTGLPTAARNIAAALPFEIAIDMLP